MRITLATELCQGHGRCYTLAPELFEPDDLGHCVLRHDEVPAGQEDAARNGVDNCPEHALTLHE